MHAPPQQKAEPRHYKPVFNKTYASPSPKPAKVKIIDVKEPKIIDNTVKFHNNEKIQKPEFRKVFASPSPKPAKVKIIKIKEPKIIDNTEKYHNNEKYPTPEFRKVYSPKPKEVKVITPKIIEPKIKDITSAPEKVCCCFKDLLIWCAASGICCSATSRDCCVCWLFCMLSQTASRSTRRALQVLLSIQLILYLVRAANYTMLHAATATVATNRCQCHYHQINHWLDEGRLPLLLYTVLPFPCNLLR
jgi:hypothetical protein